MDGICRATLWSLRLNRCYSRQHLIQLSSSFPVFDHQFTTNKVGRYLSSCLCQTRLWGRHEQAWHSGTFAVWARGKGALGSALLHEEDTCIHPYGSLHLSILKYLGCSILLAVRQVAARRSSSSTLPLCHCVRATYLPPTYLPT